MTVFLYYKIKIPSMQLFYILLFSVFVLGVSWIAPVKADLIEINSNYNLGNPNVGVEKDDDDLINFLVEINNIETFYDTEKRGMLVHVTLANHKEDGVFWITLGASDYEHYNYLNSQDIGEFEKRYSQKKIILSKGESGVASLFHPGIPIYQKNERENNDLYQLKVYVTPPFGADEHIFQIATINFKNDMASFVEQIAISEEELSYSVTKSDSDQYELKLENSQLLTKNEVVQLIYLGDSTQCKDFKVLDENRQVERFAASKFYEVKIVTDFDKGFQDLKFECVLNTELNGLEHFPIAVFADDERLEENLGSFQFFKGDRTQTNVCILCDNTINIGSPEGGTTTINIENLFEISIAVSISAVVAISLKKILKKNKKKIST